MCGSGSGCGVARNWPFCAATSCACPWPHRTRRPGARRSAALCGLEMPLRMGKPSGMLWGNDLGQGGWDSRCTMPQGWETHLHCAHVASAITRDAADLGYPVAHCWVSAGRRAGGWVCSTFQMAEDLADHRALRDDGDKPQCPALTTRAVRHVKRKAPMQQPRPAPARRPGVRLLVHPWLTWRRDDAPA
jgi:hypothetical protein